jgi:hypothetical protein
MKGFTKIMLIVASILGVIGLASVLIAVVMGFSLSNIKNMIWDGKFSFNFNTIGEATSSEKQIEDSCDKMDIKFGAGQLEIYYGDVEEIQVKWKDIPNLKVEVHNGTLSVKEKDGINFNFDSNIDRKMEIIIPRDTQFKKIELEVGAGLANISELNVEKFDLEVGAGQANVSGLSVETFDIEVGAGQINVELGGAENEYNYDVKCGVGNVVIGTTSYSGLGTTQDVKNNGATKDIKVDCGVGEVKIQFEN